MIVWTVLGWLVIAALAMLLGAELVYRMWRMARVALTWMVVLPLAAVECVTVFAWGVVSVVWCAVSTLARMAGWYGRAMVRRQRRVV